MTAHGDLRADLRALGKRYGWPTLMAEMCDLVREFAVRGMEARVEEERADPDESCPRCRRNAALMAETRAVLKRSTTAHRPPAGAAQQGEGDAQNG